MSTLKHYLNESAKEYDFKIKIAGDIADDFATRMETALQKYDVKKLSAGKKTPIQEHPLDFPQLKNIQDKLSRLIGEKVVINQNAKTKKGFIKINFSKKTVSRVLDKLQSIKSD